MHAARKHKSVSFISPLGLPLLMDPPKSGAGGAERQFFLFGKGLLSIGWSVCYITANKTSIKTGKTAMPVVTASFAFMGGNKLRVLTDWISLFYAMWRADSYYYIIKTPAYLLVPMFIFTKIFRRKLVFWAQTDFDAYPEMRPKGKLLGVLMNMGISWADIILAQSNRQVAGFKKNFAKQAKLIKSISGRLCEKTEREGGNRSVDILWVGNSMENKRYEIVISLAKMLPEYTFALAMNKADSVRYTQANNACDLLANLEFLGEVNPVEMDAWFSRARMLLNTSVREGFPNTFLQAWEHGLPVVSICVDPDELITKRKMGFVTNMDSKGLASDVVDRYANELRSTIKSLLTDRELYDELSGNAQKYVRENHGEEILVAKLEQLLLGE